MKRFLAVSLLVAACGTPAVTPSELNPTEATTARTVKIAPPPLEFTAVVTSRISSVISTQVQGRIKELKLHSGQLIKAGELVASIDKSELQTELVAAQAAEKSAMMQEGVYGAQAGALHKKAVAESRLVALGVSAPISSATADAEYAQNGAQAGAAAAKAAEARANREQKEKDLANTDITAPISGVVTNIKAHEGENAQKGAPLARVFDPSDLIVRFAVPKEHRTELRLGQRVELDVEGNARPVWATVTNISGVQEPPINFIVVEADIDDSKLAPGELSVATVGRVKIADARDARGAKP
ncbi:MAG TPA: HlyD family efflux transporter periplasmic adaptor subunit [Kofleriaceae bacterium]|jgi:RND family efflux transporter MFP subunit|nr:HlyD family efflux transporter periplasmic adaptor subunit [Kofleriaceae bacterium]